MPTYIFECPKCKQRIEIDQSIREHETFVPTCVADGCDGQQFMRTVIQPVGLVFKGSGWTQKGSSR